MDVPAASLIPKCIQFPLADRRFITRASGEAHSAAAATMEAVPVTMATWPGAVIPEPSSWHIMSPLPATTGVPASRPVRRAASSRTAPMTVPEPAMSGSLDLVTPRAASRSADHCPVTASQRNVPDASAGSVAATPDRRRFRKSFATSRLAALSYAAAAFARSQDILNPAQAGSGRLPATRLNWPASGRRAKART
jgi:hypothetical protein